MFFLPSSRVLLTDLPIPSELVKLPAVPLLHILVTFTRDYRSMVPDMANPRTWQTFRSFIAERSEALKNIELSNTLYENDAYPFNAICSLSIAEKFRRMARGIAEGLGFSGIADKEVEEADPEALRQFCAAFMDRLWTECQVIDAWEPTESDTARQERYWKVVHPRRRPEVRLRIERDMAIFSAFLFYLFHNAIGTMAYGESVSSMVQRALAGGEDADLSMCRAVRVDNRLRQHPVFVDRYQRAARYGDSDFMRRFNDISTPFTDKIRFPGLYFLMSLADGFGVLPRLSNSQLLDLADHAGLHRYENRIEDAGYMGKRRNEYLRRKYQRMSMH